MGAATLLSQMRVRPKKEKPRELPIRITATTTFPTGLCDERSPGAMLSLERTAQPWSNARLIAQNDELDDSVAAG
jgi:hypothetical protein